MNRPRHLSRLAWLTLVTVVTFQPGSAMAGEVPELSDAEFVKLAEVAMLPGLRPPGPVTAITGDQETDAEIRALAEARGYLRRPTPAGPLVSVGGSQLQPAAALAFQWLQDDAAEAGYSIRLVSGFRSEATQAHTFLSGAGGSSMVAYEARLAWSAPPGYSKHHTGYVVDLALPGQSHNDFGRSEAYRWLVADNYAVLKSFGFVPSYPPGGPPQGPNPEPWELAFVGGWTFRCWRQLLFGDVVSRLGGPPRCPE